jgi:hypothetical protein
MEEKKLSEEELRKLRSDVQKKRWANQKRKKKEEDSEKDIYEEDTRSEKRFDFDCFKPFKLRAKQKEFIVTFMNAPYFGRKEFAPQVYQKIYTASNDNSCRANCSALMNKSKIKEAIIAYQVHALKTHKTEVTTETIENLRRRANYPINVFYNDNGTCKNLNEIPLEWHICIDNIKIDKKSNAGKDPIETKEYKLCDRDKARQDLAKYLNIFQEMEALNVTVPVNGHKGVIETAEDKENKGGPRIILNMSVGNPGR